MATTALATIDGLSRSFGGTQAVRGISFALGEGRCTALLGPNGAGKTTTIRMLTGLLEPTAGQISFRGLKPGADPRAFIGYLPQIPAFHGWMTGAEFLRYAAGLCGMPKKEAAQRSAELLERVGLGAAGKRRIGGYSGGMKQRLGLAQALIHRPGLLVLDEPVSALDPIGRREVMELLGELKRETTILFSTHVLHDAEELCDDVVIMRGGTIAMSGALSDIRESSREPIMLLGVEDTGEARAQLGQWLTGISSNESILSVEHAPGSSSARLHVRDLVEARRYVLRQLSERSLPVTQLEIGYTSLEDLFMKAVSQS
ncbi:ABC transporter ATP-binding protein [Paenibacillus silvisoli]|uniref:ABC transporter ATP-binding protein n=1 Tax=Paenibacillus silvisoli TaxID=3110539 RepID=UPI002804E766|nr:ABC transporter ATP-binding protein [Paenibacillus silvisoli]